MTAFIAEHRDHYGVEPICKVLPIAPSTYYQHAARQRDRTLQPRRMQRDDVLSQDIRRVWDQNFQVYGVRKVWRQLHREGRVVARCTVTRLMKRLGLRGVVRGKAVKTTVRDPARPCPLDRVNRQFRADRPNALWVSDFTYVSTWQGMAYVAFVIDVFARRIVGWRVSLTAHTDFVLDALEQAVHERGPAVTGRLITTPIAAVNTYRSATPSAWPRRASNRRSAAWRFLRQRPGRDDQRPVQSRSRASTILAGPGQAGTGHAPLGALV